MSIFTHYLSPNTQHSAQQKYLLNDSVNQDPCVPQNLTALGEQGPCLVHSDPNAGGFKILNQHLLKA